MDWDWDELSTHFIIAHFPLFLNANDVANGQGRTGSFPCWCRLGCLRRACGAFSGEQIKLRVSLLFRLSMTHASPLSRYSNSKSRREGGLLSLADPATALRALAQEERQKVYEDRVAAKRARIAEAIGKFTRNPSVACDL